MRKRQLMLYSEKEPNKEETQVVDPKLSSRFGRTLRRIALK